MKIDSSSKLYKVDLSSPLSLPFYEFGLVAGFPSPAADYVAASIDLNIALMLDSENTKLVKVTDYDMEAANIFRDDLAILDSDLKPVNGNIIHCQIDGENLIRRYTKEKNKIILKAEDERIEPIQLNDIRNIVFTGVVTYTITSHIPTTIYANGIDDDTIDLNKLLVKKIPSTFYGLIDGNSMKNAKILNGDLAVIDKSISYINGYKAMCRIRDKFTIKLLEWDKKDKDVLWLMPANEEYEPIKLEKEDDSMEVWGIVTNTITPHIRVFRNNKKK